MFSHRKALTVGFGFDAAANPISTGAYFIRGIDPLMYLMTQIAYTRSAAKRERGAVFYSAPLKKYVPSYGR
jgi:hypothetical protein